MCVILFSPILKAGRNIKNKDLFPGLGLQPGVPSLVGREVRQVSIR